MFKKLAPLSHSVVKVALIASAFAPLAVFGAGVQTPPYPPSTGGGAPNLGNVESLTKQSGNILNYLIPIAITLALLFFIWGLAKFILASGNEEKKAEGKNIMLWGIIALFIIVSIWGIIGFIGNALGIGGGGTGAIPGVKESY